MPKGIYKRTAEHNANISFALRGRKFSSEHRAKISVNNVGNTHALGCHHMAESRVRTSVALKGKGLGRKLSPEHRRKISEANLGKRFSPETCIRIAESAARRVARGDTKRSLTPLHLDLANFLLDAGFDLVPEVQFGRACVDLYEPILHLAFEADGNYYHGLPGRREHDRRRDAELLRRFDLPVVRFTEAEIKELEQEGSNDGEPAEATDAGAPGGAEEGGGGQAGRGQGAEGGHVAPGSEADFSREGD